MDKSIKDWIVGVAPPLADPELEEKRQGSVECPVRTVVKKKEVG
jgi:hypothetical protein